MVISNLKKILSSGLTRLKANSRTELNGSSSWYMRMPGLVAFCLIQVGPQSSVSNLQTRKHD